MQVCYTRASLSDSWLIDVAVYAIEATVHAPTWEGVYGEIFKVLKPGGIVRGVPASIFCALGTNITFIVRCL